MIRDHMINVSIVTYNTDLGELTACLDSLRSDVISNIYIVDNSSQSRIRSFCIDRPRVIYYPQPNNGYGAGHNIAIRETLRSSIPYHLVLNSDLFFSPGILSEALKYMECHPECGLLHPRMIDASGSEQYTARRLPSPFDLILRRFLPRSWFSRHRELYLLKNQDLHSPLNVPYVQGSFMLLRSDALRKVGLFDERFFMYPEDIDLTRRLHRHFTTIRYPYITVTHIHKAASYHNLKMLRIHIVNMIRYFNKWGWFSDHERAVVNHKFDD